MGRALSKNIRGGDDKSPCQIVNYSFTEPVARVIAAVLYQPHIALQTISAVLKPYMGDWLGHTCPIPFTNSSYYCTEMGENLVKAYLVFEKIIEPTEIIGIKHQTTRIEHQLADIDPSGKRLRTVNIDPGFFTHAQLILATHKNYSHRLYLGQGVFAELTYLIQGKKWICLPWTYPDYRTEQVIDFFSEYRRQFVKVTKDRRENTQFIEL